MPQAGTAVSMLRHFPMRRRIDRVADLLGAGHRGFGVELCLQPGLFLQIFHHKLRHRARQIIAVAYKKHSCHLCFHALEPFRLAQYSIQAPHSREKLLNAQRKQFARTVQPWTSHIVLQPKVLCFPFCRLISNFFLHHALKPPTLNIQDIIFRDLRAVHQDYGSLNTVRFFQPSGGSNIAAAVFFLIRLEPCNGRFRLPVYDLRKHLLFQLQLCLAFLIRFDLPLGCRAVSVMAAL